MFVKLGNLIGVICSNQSDKIYELVKSLVIPFIKHVCHSWLSENAI